MDTRLWLDTFTGLVRTLYLCGRQPHDLITIPIRPGTKHPAVKDWQRAADAIPEATRREWLTRFGDCGIGLALGTRHGDLREPEHVLDKLCRGQTLVAFLFVADSLSEPAASRKPVPNLLAIEVSLLNESPPHATMPMKDLSGLRTLEGGGWDR